MVKTNRWGGQRALKHCLMYGATAIAVAACGGGGADDEKKNDELTILHINDHHSSLASKTVTLQLPVDGKTTAVTVDAAGFPRVTAAIEVLAATSSNVLKLHAGDAITGTLYFNRAGADGEADMAMMNTVCFDAYTLGNHEFDKGDTGLKGILDRLKAGSCKTEVLSANVKFGANSALNPSRAPNLIKPSTIIERGGNKIGIVGLTIAQKTKASSSPDKDTLFEDEASAAQREIDKLQAQGVKRIVLLSHIGYGYDKELAAKLRGVDVIVGGDSHTLLGPDAMKTLGVGNPAGAYPTRTTDKVGKPVCVVQAWEYSQVVGELKVQFDKNGVVTECKGTPHVLIGEQFKIAGKDASDMQRTAIVNGVNASGFLRMTAPSAMAQTVLKPFIEKVASFNVTKVAIAPKELCSRRVPGGEGSVDYSRSSAACNAEGSVSVRGGDIQQLVAQAYLEVANLHYGGADISLQSGGGVRVPLLDEVTAANAIQVLPFGNMLYRLSVTGAEVKAMLEDGLEAVYGAGGSSGPYPYTGGLRFDVNAGAALGARVSSIEIKDSGNGQWGPLDVAKTYRLFVLSFNANGGDGYKTLAAVPAARRLDIGVLDADVFLNYIDNQPKDAATGLPVLQRLPADLYSTKSFVGGR